MELENLKASWQEAGKGAKSSADLQAMTEVKNHPKLRRIRVKLLIESGLLIVFLLTYKNAFDGADKPQWLNGVLIGGALLFILSDLMSYWLVRNRGKDLTVVSSLKKLELTLNKVAVFSVVSALVFGAAVILFFSFGLVFDQTKYIVLTMMVLSLLGANWWSMRLWKARISYLREVLVQFGVNVECT